MTRDTSGASDVRGSAAVVLVVAVACLLVGGLAGGTVAARFVVPAEVRLPMHGSALSEYGLTVRRGEALERNSRQTIAVSERHDARSPLVSVRYFRPRKDGMDLRRRFDLLRGSGPGSWFARSCAAASTAGAAAPASPAPSHAGGEVVLDFGDGGTVQENEWGYWIDYVKRCPDQPAQDRHGRLLMMAAPGSQDGSAIMIDADLEGSAAQPGSPKALVEYLHDVAERIRKLD